jgi:DNA-binding MurR/RpiR family transcriptional regulator
VFKVTKRAKTLRGRDRRPPTGTAKRPKGESIIDAVRRQFNDLSPVQKRIAEYIVDNTEALAFATVDQVAFELGTNPSTIVRFAYRLGLKGYPDLQERTRELVRGRLSAASAIINENSILTHLDGTIFGSSLGQDLQNICRTITSLDVKDLTSACDIIARATRIYIVGAFGSYGVCYWLALALDRVHGNVVLWGGNDGMVSSQALDITSSDCLLAFTAAPYSVITHRLAQAAQQARAKVIAVTDSTISGVGQVADLVITAPSAGVGSQKSLVASMAVAHALVNGVARSDRSRTLDRYNRIKRLMDRWGVSETQPADDEQMDSR